MYRERASRVPGATAWTSTPGAGELRVLPDGCIDLIWNAGQLVVAGPDTRAHVFDSAAWPHLAGVRFAPGFGPRVVGVPASELTDQRLSLAEVWPAAAVEELLDTVGSAADPLRAMEDAAITRVRPPTARDAVLDHVVMLVRRGVDVATISEIVGLSERQLHRRCLDAFGYGAKTLARILRMGRALDLARDGLGFADTAVAAGFSDQAHLSRDVKRLTGMTLGRLLAA